MSNTPVSIVFDLTFLFFLLSTTLHPPDFTSMKPIKFFLLPLLLAGFAFPAHTAESPDPIKPVQAKASSEKSGHPAGNAIDGEIADSSRWVSEQGDGREWLEIKLPRVETLIGLHLHSGYAGKQALRDFVVQFKRGNDWVDIPSANVTGNKQARLALKFDGTEEVRTDTLRLLVTGTDDKISRVAEVVVWPASAGQVPSLRSASDTPTLIFLNQAGFNTGAPKRFTAPTLEDGTEFEIFVVGQDKPVFRGKIEGNIGDFTWFEPGDSREYVIRAGSLESVPFQVGPRFLEQLTYQPAMDFMIDSRHYVGNDRRVCRGSFGWRDDHHFGWQLHTLVPQWLSNPDAYKNMPRQIVYEAPEDPQLWGALEPPNADAPDIVKLIHWGADVIVTQRLTHELLKSQLAYFLYAWPWLKQYLPEQNYEAVRDFAFATWAESAADRQYPHDETPEHDLLALKTKIGSTKGGYPPGFSIEPNLLMYEVALREKRPDAEQYFDAARNQAQWIIDNVDWNDPLTTKGQRVSEFITITGLAHFLREYPDRAPQGLKQKINEWADVLVRRSDNMWDFRKLGDEADKWVPTGSAPTMWNEPGNVVGVPAIIMAALPFVDDEDTRARLQVILWSHFDNMFGRNPVGRHFSYDAPREIPGVEHGWYSFYVGGIGRLEEARFVIDGAPKNQHYPFHPEVGDIGWTEGWVQHNVPFNLGLAYLAFDTNKLSAERKGNKLAIALEAPVSFEPGVAGVAEVSVLLPNGSEHTVELKESSPGSGELKGEFTLPANAGSGKAKISYGFGFLANSIEVTL